MPEADFFDARSVITVDDVGAAPEPVPMEEVPPGERPATRERPRYGAMHPDRIPEEAALSHHEKRQLRKLSHQLVTFRYWDDQKETALKHLASGARIPTRSPDTARIPRSFFLQ